MFEEEILLEIARFIGIAGLILFILSGVGGVLMASRTVQKINVKWLRGKMFKYHRLLSLIGTSLFLLHPIPMLFAPNTTGGMNIYHTLIPFLAPKQSVTISFGIIAFYVLLVVAISSIFIKYMKRDLWRALHYGTYVVIFLGLIHGLLISGEFKDGEIFEIEEPEKILLIILSLIALSLPIWRLFFAKKFLLKRKNGLKVIIITIWICCFSSIIFGQTQPTPTPTPEKVKRWSGNYQATLNVSVLGKPKPSLGHKLSLSYAPTFGGSFDSRFEYYVDGSYNADAPGQLINNINEPKFEAQLNYTRPLNKRFAATVGILYHYNFKFPDKYFWALGGIVYTEQLGKKVTLTATGLLEKKLSGGRVFVDGSAMLEYRFVKNWNTQLSVHRYENLGQFDTNPTQKLEYEFGVNRLLKKNQTIGISFFRHEQYNAPNDQFSFLKFKYIIGF